MNKFDTNIESELKEEVNRFILEEVVTNIEVSEFGNTIVNDIKEQIRKTKPVKKEELFENNLFCIIRQVFSKPLKVLVIVENFKFKNLCDFKEWYIKNSSKLESKTSYKTFNNEVLAACHIKCVTINSVVHSKIYDDVYYCLNNIMLQRSICEEKNTPIVYKPSPAMIYSPNKRKRNAAELIELTDDDEQNRYIGCVYSFVNYKMKVCDGGIMKIDGFLNESDAYRKIYRLKELFHVIRANKDQYEKFFLKKCGYNYWVNFEDSVKKSIEQFERKFAMVVIKCKKDFIIYEPHTLVETTIGKDFYILR